MRWLAPAAITKPVNDNEVVIGNRRVLRLAEDNNNTNLTSMMEFEIVMNTWTRHTGNLTFVESRGHTL